MSSPAKYPTDAATIAGAAGTPIEGGALEDTGTNAPDFTAAHLRVIAEPVAVVTPPKCSLPDIYDLLPEVVRQQDTTTVDRGDTTLYPWDEIPDWDISPYSWDDVLSPETILKTTMRVVKNELDTTSHEICGLKDIATHIAAPAAYLPIISAGLGMSLPGGISEAGQRVWIDNLVRWYRRKGTPVVFAAIFRNLGFATELLEKYVHREDAGETTGPPLRFVTTASVVNEVVGTVGNAPGPYRIRMKNFPVVRGSVKITFFDQSAATPTIVTDDPSSPPSFDPDDGGWSENAIGHIDYETGTGYLTLLSPPLNVGGSVKVSYQFLPDPFPDPYKRRWTDRFRSSYALVAIEAINPATLITPEVSERILLYLEELKPAHVIFERVAVVLGASDSAAATEDIPTHCILIYDHEFDCHYHGYAFGSTDNGSQSPERGDEEYIVTYAQEALEATGEPQAPYAYPWRRSGKFHNALQTSDREFIGADDLDTYASGITNDAAPSTTVFTVLNNGTIPVALAAAGAGLVMSGGDLRGEWREILSCVASPGYYTVTVTVAFPVAPAVGDAVTFLDANAVRRDCLTLRPIDTLDLYFVENRFTGNGVTLAFGPGALTQLPALAGRVLLRFTIAAVSYEEEDDGAGGFSNTSGKISSASVNYGTGAVSVTFTGGNPPDNATFVKYAYGTASSIDLGDF